MTDPAWTHSDEAYVALDGDGGIVINGETNECFAMNEIGQQIWRCLSTPMTMDELLSGLSTAANIADLVIPTAEVDAFLDELRRNGLIIRSEVRR